ncbi:MAG TPA: MBL fold metallo-hydrolase [Candidatus Limnocylindria bacterium]|nr:MBL fold metallo-hydrolase [Candidatus Limnocylindria bacterium]
MRLAPGLHRIGSDIVAAYLVEDASGVTLIDAGVSGQWRDLVAELRGMGRSVSDVRAVLLTHGDTDHIGFAERLRRDHGVPVHVHEADAARARGEVKPSISWGKVRIGPLLRFLWYAGRRGGLRTEYLTDVRTLNGAETLDLPGSPRVIPLPGHSPGSVAYHVPGLEAVFVGDGLTTRHVLTGADGPGPAPFTDDPEAALASLAAIEATGARWVLPGHGWPWKEGVAEAVRRVREAATAA